MATLARSASLADLEVPLKGPSNDGKGENNVKGGKHVNTFSRRTTTGGPNQNEVAGGKWKWLQNTKSFHEKNFAMPIQQNSFPVSSDLASYNDRFHGNKTDSAANSNRKRKVAHPLYLEHLETLLPQFCHHLSNPTYQEAANAMSLLLNSNYPKLPPEFKGPPPGSPDNSSFAARLNEREAKNSVTSEMNRLLSSPFRVRRARRSKTDEESIAEKAFGSRSAKHNSFFNTKVDKADAAAWNDFVGPLVLLAGAEAIYADLEHIHSNSTVIKWPGLYERVVRELQARLPPDETENPAEPPEDQQEATPVPQPASPPKTFRPDNPLFSRILAGDALDEGNTKRASWTGDKSKTKYKRLRALCDWIDLKIKWLPFHESLYATWSLDNLMLIRAFASALPAKHVSMDCSGHLLEALRFEIEATLALMEMGFSLERGRFLETICCARKVKQNLISVPNQKAQTALILWMLTTFQDYLAIMAVVFDKIHTFSMPLYGFDQQVLLEATQSERTVLSDKKAVVDLDNIVLDFLRRQDRAGGTSTAVGIVLDTAGLNEDEQEPIPSTSHQGSSVETDKSSQHHRVELGFALKESLKPRAQSYFPATPNVNQRQQQQPTTANKPQERDEEAITLAEPRMWPAVYLRSSMRLSSQLRSSSGNNTSVGLGLISGMRRNTNSRSGLLEGSTSSSPHGSGILSQNKNSSEGSPRSKIRTGAVSNRNLLTNANIFEYETEPASHPSWPHCEWDYLRAFLEAMMNEGERTVNVVSDDLPASPAESPRKGGASLASASTFEEPLAVTLQPDAGESDGSGAIEPAASHSLLSGGQIWDPLPTSPSLRTGATENSGTTFHAVRLSDYLWMAVLVKGEEQSRWHRKSRGLPDTDIRAFLNTMASKMRIESRFLGLKTCQTARVKVKDPLAPRVRGRDLGLRDTNWRSGNQEDDDAQQEEVVELMKEAFNVSGISPIMNRAESILTTMSGGFRPTGGSRSPRDRRRVLALKNGDSDYREFAAKAFFGPELYRHFLEATTE